MLLLNFDFPHPKKLKHAQSLSESDGIYTFLSTLTFNPSTTITGNSLSSPEICDPLSQGDEIFSPGEEYSIQATITVFSTVEIDFTKCEDCVAAADSVSYDIIANTPPKIVDLDKDCGITPEIGQALETDFTVFCNAISNGQLW